MEYQSIVTSKKMPLWWNIRREWARVMRVLREWW